jgi:hypothetical protein
MKSPWLAYFLKVSGAIIVAVVALFVYTNVTEYFGDGPPYYGRTTNMDKWENPVPLLLALGIPGLVVGVGCWWLGSRLTR